MEQHAREILAQDDLWNWHVTKRIQALGKQNDKFLTVTPKFLHFLIVESQKLGGEVLDHFWKQLGTCDEKLMENSWSKTLLTRPYRLTPVSVERLKEQKFVSTQ